MALINAANENDARPSDWLCDDQRHLFSRQNHFIAPGLGKVQAGTLLKSTGTVVHTTNAYNELRLTPWLAADAPNLIVGVLYDTVTAHATADVPISVVMKSFAYKEAPGSVTNEGGIRWPSGITGAAKTAAKDYLRNTLDAVPVAAG